jgi:phosphoserine phosphatase
VKKVGAEKRDTVAIFDGGKQHGALQARGVKIAFNAQPIVKEHADVVVDSKDLKDLLPYC